MAKKQNKTFASRAKSLIAKYKRAEFDPTEKQELESALEQLSIEQEAYKNANGMGENQVKNPTDGMPQFAGVGSSNLLNSSNYKNIAYQPEADVLINNDWFNQGQIQSPVQADYLGPTGQTFPNNSINGTLDDINITQNAPNYTKGLQSADYSIPNNNYDEGLANMPNTQSLMQRNIGTINNGSADNINQDLVPYKGSIAPQLISAGIGVAGNMYLANQAKKFANDKSNQLKAGKVQANLVNLSQARESARKEYGDASNIAKRNLRTAGSRGAYLSGVGAATTGLTKAKEKSVSDLYTKEAMMNRDAATQATNLNNQSQFQTDAFNIQNRNRAFADQQAYQSAAIGTIPLTIQNIGIQRREESRLNALGDEYTNAMKKDTKWWETPQAIKTLKEHVDYTYTKKGRSSKNKK